MSTLMKYAAEINRTATEKGFWADAQSRNKGEMVMLIVSELGECLEAHRKGITARTELSFEQQQTYYNDKWTNWFKDRIKDSYADELADTVIRIVDYALGFNIPVIAREYRKDSTGNFGHDLLRINWYILNSFHTDEEGGTHHHDWGYTLAAIEKFAEWYGINLEQHIQWKMRYNSTREKLHGKAY